MEDKLKKFVYDTFEIETDSEYQFKEMCGLTFVFKNETVMINKRLSSKLLSPVGIIYEENDEYYFAPLDEKISLSDAVKEYVKECMK
jgi:hypothetical protein